MEQREQGVERTCKRLAPFAECEPNPSVFFSNERRVDEADDARTPRRQNTARHATKREP